MQQIKSSHIKISTTEIKLAYRAQYDIRDPFCVSLEYMRELNLDCSSELVL